MQLLKIFLIFLLFVTIINGICHSQTISKGNLFELIKSIRNAMPTAGTNKFKIPVRQDLDAFKHIFTKLKFNDTTGIIETIKQYNYKIIEYTDTLVNKSFIILLEENPIQNGWGTYIYSKNSTNDITIEVPHPIWDTNTWDVGIKTFLKINAKWYIMAGTHRYANTDSSSDVAHTDKSIFNIAHQTIATLISIQIHGFNKSNNIYAGYPDIVISNGTLYPQEILYRLANNFKTFNFSTGVFDKATYTQLSRLGATTNVQGIWSNKNSKIFIHIEFDFPLRTNEINIQKIQIAFYNTFIKQDNISNNKIFKLSQNYPNPCNTHTIIEFETPKLTTINLYIFDILGQIVSYHTLNTNINGKNFIEIPIENLPSGTYFYELNSENYRESKKMLIIK